MLQERSYLRTTDLLKDFCFGLAAIIAVDFGFELPIAFRTNLHAGGIAPRASYETQPKAVDNGDEDAFEIRMHHPYLTEGLW